MFGQMMTWSLTIPKILEYAATYHADTEIVTRTVEGPIHRYGYAEAAKRTRKLANALQRLGVAEGEILGTVAWNTYRHFEIYYAVSGIGAVCHTINPRLFPEQIAYIVNHAEDKYPVRRFDLRAVARQAGAASEKREGLCDHDRSRPYARRDHAAERHLLRRPDRRRARHDRLADSRRRDGIQSLLHIGHHRQSARRALQPPFDGAAFLRRVPRSGKRLGDHVVLPVVPMFHVNAWGVPYWTPMSGAKLVFPGAGMDGASLQALMSDEGVTLALGVPTVWLNLLNTWMPTARISIGQERRHRRLGVPAVDDRILRKTRHPCDSCLGHDRDEPARTVNAPKAKHLKFTHDQKMRFALNQGRPIFGVEIKIVDADGKALLGMAPPSVIEGARPLGLRQLFQARDRGYP